ncbi:gibberellin 20 oxidase 1-like [Salvia miltiorrhiza]|uniref:gibberellin 20 oxidase 1-like n=1 Tax=Salvia miltiorrhiza TaxID=226208 RepID=UPI0025AD5B5E|nr:gibberellin 20 oxidase 1-like [Salvia miltiorrhiza]
MATHVDEEHHVESLSSSDQKLQVKDFVWSAEEWPKLKHDVFDDEQDIPVIRLSREGEEDYGGLCRKMVAAAQKWGFFKLVDHGVAAEIINDITVCLNRFYDLPMEQKLKGARTGSLPLGYSASNVDYGNNLPWAEILQLLHSPQQVLEFATRVYGDHSHHHFSNAMMKYLNAMEEVGIRILEMLATGLGLGSDFFSRHLREQENSMIRVNRYPPCPLPGRCLGLGSHSDPHTLTILLQDQVGGLQVCDHHNRWFGVRPLPNSFVVNIGDTLEAWSNGRLKSVVHRAVVNEERHRLSLAYFISPAADTPIESPLQLMNAQPKPRNYKTFTWADFRNELLKQRRVVGKTALHRYLIDS